MKRLSKSLVRLYPAEWRQRYGAEFEAMLEDVPPGWSAHFDLFKGAIRMQLSIPSFPKLALMLSLAGLLTGLGASFTVTPRYTSTAELVYEDNRAGSATAVEQFLTSEGLLLSRSWLSLMIQEPQLQLYRQDLAKAPLEDVIEKMRRDLQIAVVSQSDRAVFFRIAFTYGEPLKAQATVHEVISRFYDENTRQQHQHRQASPPMGNEERLERQKIRRGIWTLPKHHRWGTKNALSGRWRNWNRESPLSNSAQAWLGRRLPPRWLPPPLPCRKTPSVWRWSIRRACPQDPSIPIGTCSWQPVSAPGFFWRLSLRSSVAPSSRRRRCQPLLLDTASRMMWV
jgi:hypothetical protein